METKLGADTNLAGKNRVRQFYDLASPFYLKIYGRNLHDGYYVTGKESAQEAQENLNKLIAEKARITKGASILDVGCGMGGSSIWLAENLGARTTGITISPVQVDIANRLARDHNVDSSFLLMDAEHMQFDQIFDVIWVVAASTHFGSQDNFIRTASQFLARKGKFAVFDWMASETVPDISHDRYLKPVSQGMLLSSLCSTNTYLNWFIQAGYRITYSEDITDHTIKTWDDAQDAIAKPSTWKYASQATREEMSEALNFFKAIRAMKTAMIKERLKSAVIVAEKL